MTENSLQVSSIEFSYGRTRALNGVSLNVEAGRFVALVGANGAGKTTLFSIVTGLYAAHAGDVSIMGHNLRAETLKALGKMGVVFQRTTLDMDLTILQNLRYAAELHGLSRKDARERISEGMKLNSLSDLGKRKVAGLSGGQRRRVELCRALLHKPALLLLDEPTVGLDMSSRAGFVEHVRSLCKQYNTGVLWATHLMDEVNHDDDIYVMARGEIIAQGRVSDLLAAHSVDNVTDLYNLITEDNKNVVESGA